MGIFFSLSSRGHRVTIPIVMPKTEVMPLAVVIHERQKLCVRTALPNISERCTEKFQGTWPKDTHLTSCLVSPALCDVKHGLASQVLPCKLQGWRFVPLCTTCFDAAPTSYEIKPFPQVHPESLDVLRYCQPIQDSQNPCVCIYMHVDAHTHMKLESESS